MSNYDPLDPMNIIKLTKISIGMGDPMNCTHETIDCPNHAGAYDCTPFCNTCEGSQGYCPTCDVTAWDKSACKSCGEILDKFSFDNDYTQCQPCSTKDTNELFELWDRSE